MNEEKPWWEGSFEERMKRRRRRRGAALNAKLDLKERVLRLRDIWQAIRPRRKQSVEDLIKSAGGVVLTEPLFTGTSKEINPRCAKQLLAELEKDQP